MIVKILFGTGMDPDVHELGKTLCIVNVIVDNHSRVFEGTYALVKDVESKERKVAQKTNEGIGHSELGRKKVVKSFFS